MKLKCHRFDLSIVPLARAGPDGWLHFEVRVSVPGFKGAFEAEMQFEDLVRFKNDLKVMEQKVGVEYEAVLVSAEPGIFISLKSTKLGGVNAEYQFESERYDGEPTCLSGAFVMDQTFLKPLVASVSEDIKKIKV